MPFWLIVVMMVAMILLCWGGGWGIYRGVPGNGPVIGGVLGIIGLILFIALVIMFLNGGPTTTVTTPVYTR